jgi:hypothetical protein
VNDVEAVRAVTVDVHLLKNQNIRIGVRQELDNRGQLQTAIDVPINNAKRIPQPREPLRGREILGDDFLCGHD